MWTAYGADGEKDDLIYHIDHVYIMLWDHGQNGIYHLLNLVPDVSTYTRMYIYVCMYVCMYVNKLYIGK